MCVGSWLFSQIFEGVTLEERSNYDEYRRSILQYIMHDSV